MGALEDLTVKVHHCGQTKRTTFSREGFTFETLCEWIETSFGVIVPLNHGSGLPRLAYRDTDGDTVTISSTKELLEAINLKAADAPLSLNLSIPRPRERWHRLATAGGFTPDHSFVMESAPHVTFAAPSDANEADNESTSGEKKSETPSAAPSARAGQMPGNFEEWEARRRARFEWRTAVAEARRNGVPPPPLGINHPAHRSWYSHRHHRYCDADMGEEMHQDPVGHADHPYADFRGRGLCRSRLGPDVRMAGYCPSDTPHYPHVPHYGAYFASGRSAVNTPHVPWHEPWAHPPYLNIPATMPTVSVRTPWMYPTQPMTAIPTETFSSLVAPPAAMPASSYPEQEFSRPRGQKREERNRLKDYDMMTYLPIAILTCLLVHHTYNIPFLAYVVVPILALALTYTGYKGAQDLRKSARLHRNQAHARHPEPLQPPVQCTRPEAHAAAANTAPHSAPFHFVQPSYSHAPPTVPPPPCTNNVFPYLHHARRAEAARDYRYDERANSSSPAPAPSTNAPTSVLIEPHEPHATSQLDTTPKPGARSRRA